MNNTPDGMPKIAEVMKSKNGIFVAVGVVAIVIVGVGMIFTKSQKEDRVVREETYQVEADNVPVGKPMQAGMPHSTMEANQQAGEETSVSAEVITAMIAEKKKELQMRLSAPLLVVNNNEEEKNEGAGEKEVKKKLSNDPNTRFMEQVSDRAVKPATASSLGSLGTIIAEGSFLHAILEPATDSDLPGYLRAIISEPAYSEDGSQILVPKGSRLVGEYKSGMIQGQSRVFVVWTRLITPAGISIQLGSAGVDSLGVSGMGADVINRHFWQRFGMASLLSIIGAGSANSGVAANDQANSAATYRSAVSESFAQAAGDSLQQDGAIAPTLQTHQGKPIMVFVARDLQFADALKKVTPSISVF